MVLFAAKCQSAVRLIGKTAVITGANSGIGKETAKDFYIRGCKVVMVCRDMEKANTAMEDIIKECSADESQQLGKLGCVQMDLGSLESVRQCAKLLLEKEEKIHILVNNAGIMVCPFSRTIDGLEIQWGTKYLGHFLFTLLLLPKLYESRPARIVNLASVAYLVGHLDFDDLNWEKRPYDTSRAYGQSKLCMILFTQELARRLEDRDLSGINVYSVHPGAVATDLTRHLGNTVSPVLGWIWDSAKCCLKTPQQGAQTSIYCAVDEKVQNETGLHYADCKRERPAAKARNLEDAKMLWDKSMKYVQLENFDPFTF